MRKRIARQTEVRSTFPPWLDNGEKKEYTINVAKLDSRIAYVITCESPQYK